jgi:hypothetical protein
MWETRRLTTPWASTAYYGVIFSFVFFAELSLTKAWTWSGQVPLYIDNHVDSPVECDIIALSRNFSRYSRKWTPKVAHKVPTAIFKVYSAYAVAGLYMPFQHKKCKKQNEQNSHFSRTIIQVWWTWNRPYTYHNFGLFHRPFFFCLEHTVSETGFCLRVQVVPNQLGPIDSLCLRVRRQR